jgi:simple sugar transport system ATP-binding protein
LYELSGGNINKVIAARELVEVPDLIIFSEPSWGLDVHSTAFFFDHIRSLVSKGSGAVIISSDLEEVLSLAHTIVVLYRGAVAAILKNEGIDRRTVGEYMLGVKRGIPGEKSYSL